MGKHGISLGKVVWPTILMLSLLTTSAYCPQFSNSPNSANPIEPLGTPDETIRSSVHIDNLTKAASFFASLQGPDGGMMEAEDNPFENTDNTLESIWVWSRYYELTADNQYFNNIWAAWNYSVAHKAWQEPDSGKVYSCAWALRAEMQFRRSYNNWTYNGYSNTSALFIKAVNAWEPGGGFDTIARWHIKGWGTGNLYEYAIDMGNDENRTAALQFGNETMAAVEADPSLLYSESWALAGGALIWGIAHSTMREYPNATWLEVYAPNLKTSVPNPGVGPGNSQNGWEAWYAFGHKATYDITGNVGYYLNFMNITANLTARDGDKDGGLPTNIGDPDDTDESWVTSYWVLFCLEPFTQLGAGTPPSAPDIISADLTGTSDENVTLTWNLSPESDVILYEIYYSTVYGTSGNGYMLLDAVWNTTNTYVHEYQTSTVFYVVKARDIEDWRTPSSNQGVRYSMNLSPGKMLISIPFPLASSDPATIFQDVNFDSMWYYNTSDLTDHWKLYSKFKTNNDLNYIDNKMAVWINIIQNSNFTIGGVIPASVSIQLAPGWNLVPYPSFVTRTVSEALIGINYERVEGFIETTLENLELLSDSNEMYQGYGYWIKTSTGGLWTVPN